MWSEYMLSFHVSTKINIISMMRVAAQVFSMPVAPSNRSFFVCNRIFFNYTKNIFLDPVVVRCS